MSGKMKGVLRSLTRHVVLAMVSAVLVVGTGEWSEDAEDLVSTVDVDAVLGRTASLPCDVAPDAAEDRVYMVLWFRKSGGKPIYSFDVRGRSFNKALQWSDPGNFGPRAYFATVARPAALTLSSVQLDDEGTYRCRVDFKNSPTRNFQIRLTVIVPPHQMLLYDKSGADVSGVVGPLEEGSALVLVCEVRGGRPEPVVSWLIDGMPAPQYIGVKTDTHVVVNRLELQHLKREDLNTTFRCRAANTHLVAPQEKSVRLEMNLAPLSVSLVNRPQQLIAGAASTLRCIAEGSRPSAQISWFKDNRSFEREKISDHSNDTRAISTLVFTPTPLDNGAVIKCIAANPSLPRKAIDDSVQLNIVYSPLVTLTLGSTLNPHDIKEGDDVYFECNVRANPREHRISWFHNDRSVTQNMTSGIIVSTRSLVLQKVTRQEAGGYACKAANARGETSSEVVRLRVQYAPVCAEPSPQVVGAALDEALHVRCSVHADPAQVSFLWEFNNSGESFNVSPARYGTVNSSISELRYTPASERDYGALTCRGTNSVGIQAKPCVFQIVPAARPSPPRNCTVSTGNGSNWIEDSSSQDVGDSLVIRCVAGYDGGLPQLVVLEAFDSISGLTRFNITANETDGVAIFLVPVGALWSIGGNLQLTVHARNDKGNSDRITLHSLAYRDPERRTDGGSGLVAGMSSTTFWAIILTLVVGFCAVVFIAFLLRRKKAALPTKQQSPELQLNAGDGQYVVAYTLKPPKQAQPDILNPPPDGDPLPKRCPEAVKNGPLRDEWSSERGVAHEEPRALLSPSTAAPSKQSSGSTTLSRREHLIAEEIPGPESCV
ncbi:neural cell adhesion molecule 1-like isoform X1 [Choristoneura fumiferana]|uniref:neural cell adhesion molecule 1-like isoform X1 n=1 Tax=Choristoneura fumiferana TaxID=7141 RepID=UPI003D15A3E9